MGEEAEARPLELREVAWVLPEMFLSVSPKDWLSCMVVSPWMQVFR